MKCQKKKKNTHFLHCQAKSLITRSYKKNVGNHEGGIHTLDGWTPKALYSRFMYLP